MLKYIGPDIEILRHYTTTLLVLLSPDRRMLPGLILEAITHSLLGCKIYCIKDSSVSKVAFLYSSMTTVTTVDITLILK